ncbi:hypothetical protein TcWFU_002770 [Taenia crassiceps]|uniref:Uncharacterized protein n=1 Tax=Taenia crassiceps TaxID=6207 RepID=A0ABR4QKM9_9CEST
MSHYSVIVIISQRWLTVTKRSMPFSCLAVEWFSILPPYNLVLEGFCSYEWTSEGFWFYHAGGEDQCR